MAGNRSDICYWTGVVMAATSVAIVIADHTHSRWQIEFAGIPLAWLVGGAAILSILIHELIHSVAGPPAEKKIQQPKWDIETTVFPPKEIGEDSGVAPHEDSRQSRHSPSRSR